LKLAHEIQHYWPFVGGGEKYCQTISEALAGEHKVNLYTTNVTNASPLTYSNKKSEVLNGVEITRIPGIPFLAGMYGFKKLEGRKGSLLQTLSSMDTKYTWPSILVERAVSSSLPHKFRWLTSRYKEADFIVFFNMITGLTSLSYLAARLIKKPFVMFPFYHIGLETFEKPSLFKILREATIIVCSTNFEKKTLINRGLNPHKLRVINEGINPPSVDSLHVRNLQRLLDGKKDQFLVMYVGRRDYDKGYYHVLSSVSRIAKTGIPIKLIACGQGDPGNNSQDYNFLKANNHLLDLRVADEPTKIAAMSLCDAVVLPSRAETYPLAFVESWMLGKPVVGAKIGSVSSVVKDNVTGLLVEFGNVSGLVKALKLLYENPAERYEMGRRGLVYARNQLTLEQTTAKLKGLFEELSGQV
jgi:glycosyltransferase involved in cell wall biosynthesis